MPDGAAIHSCETTLKFLAAQLKHSTPNYDFHLLMIDCVANYLIPFDAFTTDLILINFGKYIDGTQKKDTGYF